MKVRLFRQGQFPVVWHHDNSTQCGWAGNDVLSYRVELVASEADLDGHGFLIDNMTIHHWFTANYHNVERFDSCEEIALHANRAMRDILPCCVAINVGISGEPDAVWITAEWDASEEQPKIASIAA